VDDSLDTWFKREILCHEAALLGYLTRAWPHRDDIADIAQETYARVYEAAIAGRPTSPRAFVFTTARHLMTDRIRRERIVSIQSVGDIESLNVLSEELSTEQRVNAYQELTRLAAALDALPKRCREVVWLRRVEELSQREVAERLKVSIKAVEHHIAKGGRLLAEFFLKCEKRDAGTPRSEVDSEQSDEERNR
jgi:RNA polymerase sigma factor (sigma-70 family)